MSFRSHISYRTPPLSLVFSNSDWKSSTFAFVRALVALFSSILLWVRGQLLPASGLTRAVTLAGGTGCCGVQVGAWDLMTTSRFHRHYLNTITHHQWDVADGVSYVRSFVYLCVGAFLLTITDTYYMNASMYGGYGTDRWWQHSHRALDAVGLVLRVALSFIGQLGLWVGMYDLMDNTLENTVLKNSCAVLIGLFLMIITGSICNMAFIWPDLSDDEFPPVPTPKRPFLVHLGESCRATLAILSQNLVWMGVYNLLETFGPSSFFRELFYISTGLLLMVSSRTLVANSWIETPYAECEEQKESVLFYFRAAMSICGQVINNCGTWTLFDVHMVWFGPEHATINHITFLVIGVLGLAFSNALLPNVGIMDQSEVFLAEDEYARDRATRSEKARLIVQ